MRWGIGQSALVVVLGVALAGCAIVSPAPDTTSPTPSGSAVPERVPGPEPTLVAGGGAADNRAYFDLVNSRLLTLAPDADGRSIVDNLVAAGFDKAVMELTPDRTSVDLVADSIQFSVRFGDGCLIGQAGSKTGYASEMTKVLGTGRCLIGHTRVIDW